MGIELARVIYEPSLKRLNWPGSEKVVIRVCVGDVDTVLLLTSKYALTSVSGNKCDLLEVTCSLLTHSYVYDPIPLAYDLITCVSPMPCMHMHSSLLPREP